MRRLDWLPSGHLACGGSIPLTARKEPTAANDMRMISFCASETNTRMVDVVSDMHVMRTRVDLSDVRLSVLSAQLSGVSLFVFFEIPYTRSECVARPPHSPW